MGSIHFCKIIDIVFRLWIRRSMGARDVLRHDVGAFTGTFALPLDALFDKVCQLANRAGG